MKKFILGLFLLTSVTATLSSCKDQNKIPAPAEEDLPLIFPRATPGKDSLDFAITRLSENALIAQGKSRSVIEFTINPTSRDIKLHTVEIYKSYGRDIGGGTYVYTPRVKLTDVNEFPKTLSYNSTELLDKLTFNGTGGFFAPLLPLLADGTLDPTRSIANYTPGSAILLTFEYILEDGRRIVLTPLDRGGVATGTFTNPPYALRILSVSR